VLEAGKEGIMKLLLHICCAPCLIYPLERLREKKIEVVGVFFNPNVHGFNEHSKRKQAVEDFCRVENTAVFYPEYKPREFFEAVYSKSGRQQRCSECWNLRLSRAADLAKLKKADAFSTTLLVSPYQDHALLKEIGHKAAAEKGIDFYYEDFRSGFKDARDKARQKGLYSQKYCGCIYSQDDIESV